MSYFPSTHVQIASGFLWPPSSMGPRWSWGQRTGDGFVGGITAEWDYSETLTGLPTSFMIFMIIMLMNHENEMI